jgi:pimeloyl-ACP methyl ester carboxylesterase
MSAPFGGLPVHLDPEGGPSTKRALVLPGAVYSPSHPLLEFGRVALQQHGWSVRQLWWDLGGRMESDERIAWVSDRVDIAVEEEQAIHPAPETWLVMAKSLGTLSVLASHRASAYVLLTPLLTNASVVAGIERLRADGLPVLLVGGTADDLWSADVARRLDCEVLEVEDADHGMYVEGDAVRSVEAHLEVTRAVDSFLSGLAATG